MADQPEVEMPEIENYTGDQRYIEDMKNYVVGILLAMIQPYATIITAKAAAAAVSVEGLASFVFARMDIYAGAAIAVPTVLLFIKATKIPTKQHRVAMRIAGGVMRQIAANEAEPQPTLPERIQTSELQAIVDKAIEPRTEEPKP